jgi:hypothetical protein
MVDTVSIQVPQPRVKEASSFNATVYFRDAGAASIPTNIRYRLDCLTTGYVISDWTVVSPASSVSIAVTATQNAIRSSCNRREQKQITVAANYGLSTQINETAVYEVQNLQGIS